MENLEKFDECAGLILAVLTEAFPKRIRFDCGDVTSANPDIDVHFVGECMTFLRDEGFIEYGDISLNFAFIKCRLTLKGVSCLREYAPALLKHYRRKEYKDLAKIAIEILNKWITQRR